MAEKRVLDWERRFKELSARGVLMRDDFRALAIETVNLVLALSPAVRPPENVFKKIDKVMGGEAYLYQNDFPVLLARLAYYYRSEKRFAHWLENAARIGEIKAKTALAQFPDYREIVQRIFREDAAATEAFNERAAEARKNTPKNSSLNTRNLKAWPKPHELQKLLTTLGLLHWVFDSSITVEENQKVMAGVTKSFLLDGMDGLELYAADQGCVIVGFDHDSEMPTDAGEAWPGLLNGFPKEMAALKREVFGDSDDPKDYSFCVWYLKSKKKWEKGKFKYSSASKDADGAQSVWFYLPQTPKECVERYSWYFGEELDLKAVKAIYAHEKATDQLLKQLRPQKPKTVAALKKIKWIQYPR